jgi:peptide/nickel transport system permease protein
LRHVLPNASLPVITVLGLNAAALIGGAVVVEVVFGIPGLGQVLDQAVSARDYPVIQGVALITALIVVLINGLTDLAYVVIDPRVRVAA